MLEDIPPTCDSDVVGAIIQDDRRRTLVFDRARPPDGASIPCGHRDEHGTWLKTLTDETREETGLTIVTAKVVIVQWVPNRCRRPLGPMGVVGHTWTIFQCTAAGELNPDPAEATNPRWEYQDGISRLARRTILYGKGAIPEQEWLEEPGLESALLWLLSVPGLHSWRQMLHLTEQERHLALHLAMGGRPLVAVT